MKKRQKTNLATRIMGSFTTRLGLDPKPAEDPFEEDPFSDVPDEDDQKKGSLQRHLEKRGREAEEIAGMNEKDLLEALNDNADRYFGTRQGRAEAGFNGDEAKDFTYEVQKTNEGVPTAPGGYAVTYKSDKDGKHVPLAALADELTEAGFCGRDWHTLEDWDKMVTIFSYKNNGELRHSKCPGWMQDQLLQEWALVERAYIRAMSGEPLRDDGLDFLYKTLMSGGKIVAPLGFFVFYRRRQGKFALAQEIAPLLTKVEDPDSWKALECTVVLGGIHDGQILQTSCKGSAIRLIEQWWPDIFGTFVAAMAEYVSAHGVPGGPRNIDEVPDHILRRMIELGYDPADLATLSMPELRRIYWQTVKEMEKEKEEEQEKQQKQQAETSDPTVEEPTANGPVPAPEDSAEPTTDETAEDQAESAVTEEERDFYGYCLNYLLCNLTLGELNDNLLPSDKVLPSRRQLDFADAAYVKFAEELKMLPTWEQALAIAKKIAELRGSES